VNVAVLTTGFDAPHVDLIAILRPPSRSAFISRLSAAACAWRRVKPTA
jgi:superfamily II DNA or RNA helicase